VTNTKVQTRSTGKDSQPKAQKYLSPSGLPLSYACC
jgi:hypothetical protein